MQKKKKVRRKNTIFKSSGSREGEKHFPLITVLTVFFFRVSSSERKGHFVVHSFRCIVIGKKEKKKSCCEIGNDKMLRDDSLQFL